MVPEIDMIADAAETAVITKTADVAAIAGLPRLRILPKMQRWRRMQ